MDTEPYVKANLVFLAEIRSIHPKANIVLCQRGLMDQGREGKNADFRNKVRAESIPAPPPTRTLKPFSTNNLP